MSQPVLVTWLRRIKNLVVPGGTCHRKVLFGVCKGCYLPLNLRQEFRTWLGLKEFEIRRFVKSWTSPDAVAYDIGAHQGYYSLSFARLAPKGHVYAIESQGDVCAALKDTVSLPKNQPLGSKIAVVHHFIGDSINERERDDVGLPRIRWGKQHASPQHHEDRHRRRGVQSPARCSKNAENVPSSAHHRGALPRVREPVQVTIRASGICDYHG